MAESVNQADNNNNNNNDDDEEEIVNSRGSSYSCAEDYQLARAFIRASEDPTVGANMRSLDFKKKFYEIYRTLIDIVNTRIGSKCSHRTMASAHNRWKKISRLVLKLIGTEASVGDPPSGDSDNEEWNKQVKTMFIQRNPDGKTCFDAISMSKDFLESHPKWRTYEDENEDERVKGKTKKRRSRPDGSKKAKEKAADKEFVKSVLTGQSVDGDGESQAEKKQKFLERKEGFMDKMETSIDFMAKAFAASLQESNKLKREDNQLKLLGHLTPRSKSVLAKQLYHQMKSGGEPEVVELNDQDDVSSLRNHEW